MTNRRRVRSLLGFFVACVVFAGCSSSKTAGTSEPLSDARPDAKQENKLPTCNAPTALLDNNHSDSGYVICQVNGLHRPTKTTCNSLLPRGTHCPAPIDSGLIGTCTRDTDCTVKTDGYCGVTAASAICFCQYGCTADADCGPGNVCVCGTPVGACVPADCTADSDCGGGALCIETNDGACNVKFACQAPGDECLDDADCKSVAGSQCTLVNGKHICQVNAGCGFR